MKSIVKIISAAILVSLLMIFVVSCSESDKVNSAIENTRELEEMSADVYINAYVTHGSLKKRFKVAERIEYSNGLARVEHSDHEAGTSQVMYTDGVYAYFNGQKQSLIEYNKYNGSYTAFTDSLLNFQMDESLFEKIEDNNAGDKLIIKKNFDEKADKDSFNEIIKPFAAHVERRLNASVWCDNCKDMAERCKNCSLKDVEYDGKSIELLVENGYVERIRVKVNVYSTLDSLDTTMELDIEMNINSPGKGVLVSLPEGYANFQNYEEKNPPFITDWFSKK